MKLLVINSGSSSIKYKLFSDKDNLVEAKGLIEKIGLKRGILTHKSQGEKICLEQEIPDHNQGINLLFSFLTREGGELTSLEELSSVGHRVVHGGEYYANAVIIDDSVIKAIEECSSLAPLHNPANLAGILAVKNLLPDICQVAVFDTAFHQSMQPEGYLYPLPEWVYKKHKVRKYGFHGSSHAYISRRAAKLMDKKLSELNLITFHLGNGASMAAISEGKCIDTTMGFTPLDGLVMGTRCGSIDPAIIIYLAKLGYDLDRIDTLVNKESGLKGLSGVSSDMRDLQEVMHKNPRAQLALDIFARRVKMYLGSYYALLGKVDGFIFSGGIGENDEYIRGEILQGLENLGIELDEDSNSKILFGKEGRISKKNATDIWVIPTDEEGFIASETRKLTRG
ncbi:MAG: acetate kinase [Deltaproteobacteria bacterium]|nr:acetate kinase [Deltaproteobacteria bacterium]